MFKQSCQLFISLYEPLVCSRAPLSRGERKGKERGRKQQAGRESKKYVQLEKEMEERCVPARVCDNPMLRFLGWKQD